MGVRRKQERHGIARQPHDDEDDGGNEPERDRRTEEPGGEEGKEPAHGHRGGARRAPPRQVAYARRNLKLKRRISSCWSGSGVHSTYF